MGVIMLEKTGNSFSCERCGNQFRERKRGRRKRYCSNACRQAAFRNETTTNRAPSYPTKGDENCALELIETQDDFLSRNEEFSPSRSSAYSSKELTFEKQNSVTYKLTDGVQINTGSGRASRALGYVMEVSSGRWMARVRNLGSDLLPLGAAKQEAIRLHRCREKGTSDWMRELNLRTASEIDRASLAKERRKAPIDLMGGRKQWPVHADRAIIRNIIDVESCIPLTEDQPTESKTVKGATSQLEYDSDGYPEPPSFLNRRQSNIVGQLVFLTTPPEANEAA
jgi:hypothetical protein